LWRADYKRRSKDPDFNQKRYRRVLEKMATDVAFAERIKKIHRAANARWRNDPANRDAIRSYQAAYWADNKAAIQTKRRARLDAMTAEELQHWLKRMKQYDRAWKRRYRDKLKQDPDLYARHLDRRREFFRRRALFNLMTMGQELTLRMNNDTEN